MVSFILDVSDGVAQAARLQGRPVSHGARQGDPRLGVGGLPSRGSVPLRMRLPAADHGYRQVYCRTAEAAFL